MNEPPCHGADRDPVALGGDEQLLKRCFRTTPPKPDQDPQRGVEHAPVVRARRYLGGNPLCCHIFIFPVCPDHRAPMGEIDMPGQDFATSSHHPCPCRGLQSAAAPEACFTHFVPANGWDQSSERIGMQP